MLAERNKHFPYFAQRILFMLVTLMVFTGVFYSTAHASSGDNEPLIINTVWIDEETLRLDVSDPTNDSNSSLSLPLSTYLKDGDNSEFISIWAVDGNGKKSETVEIKNPFYNPNLAKTSAEPSVSAVSKAETPAPVNNQSAFTPDGAGTVIDNAEDADGKEFFTINSVDGNEFFLVVDRQRNGENVYFLNAVTEEDLMSLAKQGGRKIGGSESAVDIPADSADNPDVAEQPAADNESAESETRPSALSKIANNMLMLIGIVVVVGGAAYYFKIVKPRNQAYSDDYDDDGDEADEYGYGSVGEDEEESASEDGGELE